MSRTFTLGNLLDQRDLGLELAVGSPETLARRVAGAHSMELCDPSRWLEADWVMLTTGSRTRDTPQLQPTLVDDADRGGLAGIGFGVGVDFDVVPEAMLEEARRRDFPIFTVPYEVPFRAVVDFVNRSALSEHVYVMQRARGAQAYLLDSLATDAPRETIMRRLAEFIRADVALFLYDGRVDLLEGSPPAPEVWPAICSREPRLQDFDVAGLRVLSIPVSRFGQRFEWLAATAPRPQVHPQVARDALRSASQLLGVVSQALEAASAERLKIRSRLLERLLDSDQDEEAVRHAADLGLDLGDPARVVVFEPQGEAHGGDASNGIEAVEVCLRRLETILVESHIPNLLCARRTQVVALVQHADLSATEVDGWLERLAAGGTLASAGLSAPVATMEDVAASLRDATLAVQRRVLEDSRRPRAYSFEEFTLGEWLLTHSPIPQVRGKAAQLLEPLRENPELRQTLFVYLRSNLSIKATAHALHLHPNSVRYRLDRIQDLLDRPLDKVATLVDLYLAMRVEG